MNWKEEALKKQLEYKKSLGLDKSGTFGKKNKEYENILHISDAINGANFYCHSDKDEWKNLKEWSNIDKGSRVDFTASSLTDLVRSEHIPFNFFYPLEKLRVDNPEDLKLFLEGLFDNKIKVDEVTRVKIEFSSDLHKSKLLEDNTSFNAYIEYLDSGKKCGLGFEINYAEKSSPYGNTERKRMFDQPNSRYNKLTKKSGFYNAEKIDDLRTNKIKQLWVNHLLGMKMVEVKELNKFHSVHLFPKGNSYQAEACSDYLDCLNEKHEQYFMPLTFEKFARKAKEILNSKEQVEWIEYLENRY